MKYEVCWISMLLFLPVLGMELDENNLKLDKEGQREFRLGAKVIVAAGKKLPEPETNNAYLYYYLLDVQLDNGYFDHLFKEYSWYIHAMFNTIASNAHYQHTYQKASTRRTKDKLWTEWRIKTIAPLIQKYLAVRGIKYPQGPLHTSSYMQEFLSANKDIDSISIRKSDWLGINLYMHCLFRQIQRKNMRQDQMIEDTFKNTKPLELTLEESDIRPTDSTKHRCFITQ